MSESYNGELSNPSTVMHESKRTSSATAAHEKGLKYPDSNPWRILPRLWGECKSPVSTSAGESDASRDGELLSTSLESRATSSSSFDIRVYSDGSRVPERDGTEVWDGAGDC